MRTEDISPRVVVVLLGMVLTFVAFYLALMRVDTVLRNDAINSCAALSRFQKDDKGQSAVISYPIQDVYQDCLKRKGI